LPVGGADGCIDLDSPENKGLQEAIDILEPILQKVNSNNDEGGVMSRADLWALAGNIMIEEAGGPSLEYKVGRVDTSAIVKVRVQDMYHPNQKALKKLKEYSLMNLVLHIVR